MTVRDDSRLIGTLPRVVSQAEYGRRGYEVTLARYGSHRLDQWRRRGGRKPNPTLAEIRQLSEAQAASKDRRRARSRRLESGGAEAEIAACVAGAATPGPVRASLAQTESAGAWGPGAQSNIT
jgi:hypothetical protein